MDFTHSKPTRTKAPGLITFLLFIFLELMKGWNSSPRRPPIQKSSVSVVQIKSLQGSDALKQNSQFHPQVSKTYYGFRKRLQIKGLYIATLVRV